LAVVSVRCPMRQRANAWPLSLTHSRRPP